MGEFRAHYSRWRTILLVFVAMGFVAAGLWFANVLGEVPDCRGRRCLPPEILPYLGWFNVLFFGYYAISIAGRLFQDDAHLSIDPSGIRARHLSNQLISWAEVKDVTTWSQKTVVLHLHNADHIKRGGMAKLFSGFNRRLIGGDVAISLVGTDRSLDEAISAIAQFRASN